MTKPTREQIRLLKDRFIHRTDVFAYQWWSKARKEGGYIKVTTGECPNNPPCPRRTCEHKTLVPLEPKHVCEHLAGRETLGIYQLDTDDTVKWICLDVDISKGAVLPEGVDPRANVQQHTRALGRRLNAMKLPFLVEDSGSKGYHIWVFFSEPVAGSKAMALGRFLETQAEPPEGIHVEVFPKQAALRSYGSLVKLPLGKHRKTGNRCLFVDGKFQPLSDQWAALSDVKALSGEELDRIIKWFDIEITEPARRQTDDNEFVGTMSPPCLVTIMRDGVVKGSRDVAAFKLACYLRDRGMPMEMAQVALETWNERNDPPSELDELTIRIESAYSDAYSFFPCSERALDQFCDPGCRFYAEKMRKRKGQYRKAA